MNSKQSFKAIGKRKSKLKREVERCVVNVSKDIASFNQSVRNSVQTGVVNNGVGEKSVKQTGDVIREELFKIQEKMYELQSKLQVNNDE